MTVKELIEQLQKCDPDASVGHFHPRLTTWVEPVTSIYVHTDGTVLLAPGCKRPPSLFADELNQTEYGLIFEGPCGCEL